MTDISPEDILDCRSAAGHGWRLLKLDGFQTVYMPHMTLDKYQADIRRVQEFPLRDDDVMIAAYPKCGTHWLWEISNMVLRGSADYSSLIKEIAMLDFPHFEKAADLPSPRVLNSHRLFRHLPNKLLEKKIKIIHAMRNPKDVSVSAYHHFKGLKPPLEFAGSFSEYVELFMEGKVPAGSYFDYIKDWKEVEKKHPDLPILNVYYEDIKKNPVETVQRVSEFLCKPASRELCEQIADACGFDKLKDAQKEKQEVAGMKIHFKEDFGGLYRKGQIGDWKNWLTVAQNEAFDDVIQRELKDTGIEFTYIEDVSDNTSVIYSFVARSLYWKLAQTIYRNEQFHFTRSVGTIYLRRFHSYHLNCT